MRARARVYACVRACVRACVCVCLQVGLPSQEEDQKTFITSQTLEPISVDDIGRVKLGVCIHLPDEEDISEGNEIWMHKQRSNGRLILPPRRVCTSFPTLGNNNQICELVKNCCL